MQLRFTCLLAFAMLAGCATDQGPASKPVAGAAAAPGNAAYRNADFAWSTAAGKAQINGQVTYKAGNVAFSCAASGVVLTPDTPWVRSRMMILYKSTESAALPADEVRRRTPPERSQDYSAFVKRARCGPTGDFSFQGLPRGAWYVITVVRPLSGAPGPEMALMRRVTVRDGQSVNVRL